MTVIPLDRLRLARQRQRIADCLRGGGVIAYPTDTLYGLGGHFLLPAVHARIDALKGRSGQPYSAAVSGWAMMEPLLAEIPAVFSERLRPLLPGPFTFLFRAHPAIDPGLLQHSGRIGIRVPALPPLLQLIDALGFPLLSTSANRRHEPPLQDARQIASRFAALDMLIDAGELPASAGSTVVDLTASPPQIVRRGDGLPALLSALA